MPGRLVGNSRFLGHFFSTANIQLTARGLSTAEISEHFVAWSQSPEGFLYTLFFGLSFTFYGGYLSIKTAKRKSLLNSIAVGIAAIISGLFAAGSTPFIQTVISMVLVIPAALLGGYYYLKEWTFLPE
jgi:hypothetical protein